LPFGFERGRRDSSEIDFDPYSGSTAFPRAALPVYAGLLPERI
jgi:hypothetical protein